MSNSITIKKGDTVNLALTFTDSAGDAIGLSGDTVKLIARNLYDRTDTLFSKEITSFTGSNNVGVINISDEETALYNAGEYRYYIRLETAEGDVFSSSNMPLYVMLDRITKGDTDNIYLNDEIICRIEDDVILDPGDPPLSGTFSATFSATFA